MSDLYGSASSCGMVGKKQAQRHVGASGRPWRGALRVGGPSAPSRGNTWGLGCWRL